MLRGSILLLLLMNAVCGSVEARRLTTKIISKKQFVFEPNNQQDYPGLISFSMTVEQRQYMDSQSLWPSYQTVAYGEIKISTPSLLENYGVVQFIKGRHWEQRSNSIEYPKRFYLGGEQAFVHPNWVLDSIDQDPIYQSSPLNQKRLGSYSVAEFPSERPFEKNQAKDLSLYFSDYPVKAGVSESFGNRVLSLVDLEFQTCLYRLTDVPRKAYPEWRRPEREIVCFDWQSDFVELVLADNHLF